ncbi:MAG: SPOR domain-containing protein [Endozoicomonadaceae bacterium]|nr:SPOR domain-containing protein [Endozoicomonadaceae bacterium]
MRLTVFMKRVRKRHVFFALLLISMVLLLYPQLFDGEVFQGNNSPPILVPFPVHSVPIYVLEIEKPLPALPEDSVDDEELAAKDNAVPELDSDLIPVSWTLRLVAFSQIENAIILRDQLRRAGYRAYQRIVVLSNDESEVHVYVGPELVRNKADSLLTEINKKYQLKGVVVRFRP